MKKSMKSASGLLAIIILALIGYATEVVAAPYQELPPRAGHIPVYIRVGNQPLTQVHPGFAEAFHELGEIDKKIVDSNTETINNVKDQHEGSKNKEDPSGLLNSLKLPETDIASFDTVKEADDKTEPSVEAKDEEQVQSKNDVKKETDGSL